MAVSAIKHYNNHLLTTNFTLSLQTQMMSSRKFHWISSVDQKNKLELEQLHHRMMQFYENEASRSTYQVLISASEQMKPEDPVSIAFVDWFKKQSFSNIVEIGCGNGRTFNYIHHLLRTSTYTGIEVDEQSIENNRKKWPDHHWIQADAYSLPIEDESVDLIFSMYVLEHLVYPKKALDLMLQKLKPGGTLALIFPDFTCTKRFPSQQLGLSLLQSAKQKIQKFQLLDALVSLYDSRIRLQKALQSIATHPGQFMVNTAPACLNKTNHQVWADYDAVYLANKIEVANWANEIRASILFPAGTDSPFDEHTFIIIQKFPS